MSDPNRSSTSLWQQIVLRLIGPRTEGRGLRLAGMGAAMLVGFGIVAILVMVHVTSQPSFCGTCHIMRPYYKTWKESKHSQVACVECHIAPGATAEVRKKFEALSMVAKYVTATYGTRIWTEVDDAACLRCHERRLLEGKEIFHGVSFDHTPHLTETRRGLKLRCTSCHSQLMQGQHIAVTVSTCALCHFTAQKPNTGTAKCTTCHQVPTTVKTARGEEFDHAEIARNGIECRMCHENVVRGDGAVPKQNCMMCHSEPERLEKYDETDFLHKKHVSERKVDCQRCHLIVEHDKGKPPAQPASGSCASCHGDGHSPQYQLYAGQGARGVKDMPSPMYDVGVACQGCHSGSLRGGEHATQFASFSASKSSHATQAGSLSCMACHGAGYQTVYRNWKSGVDTRTKALGTQMAQTASVLGKRGGTAWNDAVYNFALVRDGNGMHNVGYALAILDKARDQMNQARAAAGLAALPAPWPRVRGGDCLSCHIGIESQSGSFGGKSFAHAPHLGPAGLECSKCHRPHDERADAEVVRFGPDGCMSCHHQPTATAVALEACKTCHGDITKGTVASFRGAFSHGQHLENGLECKSCHSMAAGDPAPPKSACTECHEDK